MRWSDVEIDARFVIYVKNRFTRMFDMSLRVENCMFEARSSYPSHHQPLDRPSAPGTASMRPFPRVLAADAAVWEQGPPSPVGSRSKFGRRLRFWHLFGHGTRTPGHKPLMFDPKAHGRGAATTALMHMETHVARIWITLRVQVATCHTAAPRGPKGTGRVVVQRASGSLAWLRCWIHVSGV